MTSVGPGFQPSAAAREEIVVDLPAHQRIDHERLEPGVPRAA
ncbi:hypothetical protein [Demequina sediminis]|nr:hypothetical protein [Demequina sediminis]